MIEEHADPEQVEEAEELTESPDVNPEPEAGSQADVDMLIDGLKEIEVVLHEEARECKLILAQPALADQKLKFAECCRLTREMLESM